MYEMQWGRKTPGMIIFLVDQSGSMMNQDKHIKVAKAIQDAVYECFLGCLSGTEVKRRFFLNVIGYGQEDKVKNLWSSWVDDEQLKLALIDAKKKNASFISPVAGGVTPMADAINLATEYINKHISDCIQGMNLGLINGIPAPIVVNITDGMPCEYHKSTNESIKATEIAASNLTKISTPDGRVRFFNLHLSDDNNTEILFPQQSCDVSNSKEGQLLFGISSELDENMVMTAKKYGLETAKVGSKAMIVNASGELISRFIQFGSAVSGVSKN